MSNSVTNSNPPGSPIAEAFQGWAPNASSSNESSLFSTLKSDGIKQPQKNSEITNYMHALEALKSGANGANDPDGSKQAANSQNFDTAANALGIDPHQATSQWREAMNGREDSSGASHPDQGSDFGGLLNHHGNLGEDTSGLGAGNSGSSSVADPVAKSNFDLT